MISTGFKITLQGFKLILKGFKTTLKGFKMILKGFKMILKGFKTTLQGFKMTVKGFKTILKSFKIVLLGVKTHAKRAVLGLIDPWEGLICSYLRRLDAKLVIFEEPAADYGIYWYEVIWIFPLTIWNVA